MRSQRTVGRPTRLAAMGGAQWLRHRRLITTNSIPFAHRRIAPHVCVADRKPHIRSFLADALEDLGFIAHRCADASELRDTMTKVAPELVVLGTLSSEEQLKGALATLALDRYTGRVMLFGGRASPALLDLSERGERLGLSMLPPLLTPFRDSDLRDNLAAFLPVQPPPRIEIEAEEAIRNGWLELWYRPKIDLRGIAVIGAHAEARVRHPTWGVLTPSSFLVSNLILSCRSFLEQSSAAPWRIGPGFAPPARRSN